MDALTKILVSLYEEAEKPTDALEYPFLIVNQDSTFFNITSFILNFESTKCIH